MFCHHKLKGQSAIRGTLPNKPELIEVAIFLKDHDFPRRKRGSHQGGRVCAIEEIDSACANGIANESPRNTKGN
jgi:hypothetical protein